MKCCYFASPDTALLLWYSLRSNQSQIAAVIVRFAYILDFNNASKLRYFKNKIFCL